MLLEQEVAFRAIERFAELILSAFKQERVPLQNNREYDNK